MFFKKHDTKDFYRFFWAFIAFLAVIIPYGAKLISRRRGTDIIAIFFIAIIAAVVVFYKSSGDLYRYKKVYNDLVHHNIELLLNSSVKICTHKHAAKNEIFYAEFLEYDQKKQLLKSVIRSDNANERIKELSQQGINFPNYLQRHQGFAGMTISNAGMILNRINNEEEWKDYLRRSKSRLPLIFDAVAISKDILNYSDEEYEYITRHLGIKSVITCPIITFKKRLLRSTKKSIIMGVISYASTLPIEDKGERARNQQFSSLPEYRREVLIQAWTISKYPKVLEPKKKEE